MKRLYFIRHGLSEHNIAGKFSGSTNSKLSNEGKKQAKKVAEEVLKIDINIIVSSPLSRALETAQIIADIVGYPKEKIYVSDFFSERSFGILEGTNYIPGKSFEDIEGAEKLDNLLFRAKKGLDWLNTLGGNNVLVVSHSSLGRAMQHNLPNNKAFNKQPSFKNAELIRLL